MFSLFLALVIAAPPSLARVAAPAAIPGAPAADRSVVAQVRELERQWGDAFLKRDFAFLERIIAPEYRLAVARPDGRVSLSYRDEWMRNSRQFEHQGFVANVIEVATAGNTAVALVEGVWTVKRRPDRPAEAIRFVVTDTWVRRNGQWQVLYRYSHRLPGAPWPPATQ